MRISDDPVDEPDDAGEPRLPVPDPTAGAAGRGADKRAEFERLSRKNPRRQPDTKAYIEGKIEMVRSDPNLTDEEKERYVGELRRRLPDE